jgi:hypothetical protein
MIILSHSTHILVPHFALGILGVSFALLWFTQGEITIPIHSRRTRARRSTL